MQTPANACKQDHWFLADVHNSVCMQTRSLLLSYVHGSSCLCADKTFTAQRMCKSPLLCTKNTTCVLVDPKSNDSKSQQSPGPNVKGQQSPGQNDEGQQAQDPMQRLATWYRPKFLLQSWLQLGHYPCYSFILPQLTWRPAKMSRCLFWQSTVATNHSPAYVSCIETQATVDFKRAPKLRMVSLKATC